MEPRPRAPYVVAIIAVLAAIAIVAWWLRAPPVERPMPIAAAEPYTHPGEAGVVRGRIVVDGPVERLAVHGCGAEAFASADGAFSVDRAPGRCSLEPTADVGGWRMVGESVPIDIPSEVELVFAPIHAVSVDPSTSITRVLVSFEADGLRVQALDDGTAERLNVGVGDLITSVDGAGLAGRSPIDQLLAAAPVTRDGTPEIQVRSTVR